MHTEEDFIHLIGQHQQLIHKVCNMYMDTGQDRKDLFQEILMNAWKGYRNFKGEAKFSTWLYRVALNTAITFYRKEKRQVATASFSEDYAASIADLPLYQDDQLTAMHRAIADLSRIDKALVMLYLDDYDYQEIGAITGITANNVAVKMSRIKTRLKETSKKYL